MKKHNIPVILLKNMVLLPNNTLKLEFNSKNNNVIDMSLAFHDGYILVASEIDKINDIAVLAHISKKIELPNGNTRVDINGLKRVKIVKFMNLDIIDEPLECIYEDLEIEQIDEIEEQTIISKIIKEFKDYSKNIPYVSNSAIALIENEKSLDKIIDIIVPTLYNNEAKIIKYLNTTSIIKRSEILLSDIYLDKSKFKIETDLDLKVKKELDDTQKEYFLREKLKLIKEELKDTTKESEIDLLKSKVDKLNCSDDVKKRILNEISKYDGMSINLPDTAVVKDYIDCLIDLPWGIYTKDNLDIKRSKKILDASHYGIEEVKERIIEYLSVLKNTNSNIGSILCFSGPPGIGKTTLAKVIAECLDRKFIKISLNGVTDPAYIMGHRRTYVGSYPGKIISEIKKCGSSNPVILLDEIDKMGSSYNDITSTLLTILDKEQNKSFVDNYVDEGFDLSNVLFIVTANEIENINAPLKDRLEIINMSGYTELEKINIAQNYLIDKILLNNGLKAGYVKITDEAIKEIINYYTKESGVRELSRQLDKLIRKIVTELVINNIKLNKLIVDKNVISRYLGNRKYSYNTLYKEEVGVVNGLAYTYYGGDILPIEVNFYKGSGKLILTGSLGDVIKESVNVALSYIKSNYKKFNINYDKLVNSDIHIHMPDNAIKKDGPSAGSAITLSIISAFSNKKIKNNIALTGEITLHGHILKIGGLKEKSLGALRSGVEKIFIPKDNMSDISTLPNNVLEKIEFIPVDNFMDIYNKLEV